MSITLKNGGQAFPYATAGGTVKEGMELRDYFAAKAMQAMISNPSICDSLLGSVARDISSNAFYMADAMLAERAK